MKSILIAEDDEPVRQGLASILRRMGWTVLEAADGAEACAVYRRNPTDVVLTDLMMPRLDGLGVLAEVRALNPSVPVVVLTGFASIERCREVLHAGANDFIPKPSHADEMERVLNRALENRHEAEIVEAIRAVAETTLNFRMPADLAQCQAAIALISAHADATGYARRRAAIRLALDEALTNAIRHGSTVGRKQEVAIVASFTPQELVLSVQDQGAGFEIASIPDMPQDSPGGRGIFLIRSFADSVRWEERGTRCIMIFRRTPGAPGGRNP